MRDDPMDRVVKVSRKDEQEASERIRKASGEVESTDPLAAFLYLLTRDHLTPSTVEEIMGRLSGKLSTVFSNGWLAQYAMDVADRLKGDPDRVQRAEKVTMGAINRIQELAEERDKLKEREGQFWESLHNSYDMETREELEKESENWKPKNALVVALHQIWKRDAKVTKLMKRNADLSRVLSKVLNCGDWYDSACELNHNPRWTGDQLETMMKKVLEGSVNKFGWRLPETRTCMCDECGYLHPTAVKYARCHVHGSCPDWAETEEEALKFVTLNPAKFTPILIWFLNCPRYLITDITKRSVVVV